MEQANTTKGKDISPKIEEEIERLNKQVETVLQNQQRQEEPSLGGLWDAIGDALTAVEIGKYVASAGVGAISLLPAAAAFGIAYGTKALVGDQVIYTDRNDPYGISREQYENDLSPETREAFESSGAGMIVYDAKGAAEDYKAVLDGLGKTTSDLDKSGRNLRSTLEYNGSAMDRGKTASEVLDSQTRATSSAFDSATYSSYGLNGALLDMAPSADESTEAFRHHGEAASDGAQTMLDLASGVQGTRLEIGSLSSTCSEAATVVQETSANMLSQIMAAIGGCRSEYDVFKNGAELTDTQIQSLTATFGDQGVALAIVSGVIASMSQGYLAAAVSASVFCTLSQTLVAQLSNEQNAWYNLRREIERTAQARLEAALASSYWDSVDFDPGIGFSYGGGNVQANAKGGILREPIIGFGLLSRTRYTMAENGPEVVLPLGQVRSSSPVNITITGNHISSDYDVDRIGQQLVRRLRLAGVMA